MLEFVTGERRSFYTDRDTEHDHDPADFDRVVRMVFRTSDMCLTARTARQRVANFAPGYVKELAMLNRQFGMSFIEADHWVNERRRFANKIDALNHGRERLSKRYSRFLRRHATVLSALAW